MFSYIEAIKKYFKDLNKFQWGQLLFILSWCPGVFLHDTVRKVLIIAALFCLSKDKIKESFNFIKTNVPKIIPVMLVTLWAWIVFIPLFFGVEDLSERIRDLGWPLEMLVFMFTAFVYAKDEFFLKTFKRIFIASLSIFLTVTIAHRASMNFTVNFVNWILGGSAFNIGCILTWGLPITIFYMFTENVTWKKSILFFIVCLIAFTMVISMFTQFWAVIITEAIATFIIVFLVERYNFKKFFKISLFVLLIFSLFITSLLLIFPESKGDFLNQLNQIMSFDKGMEEFTNKRYHIWMEAVEFIKKRPVLGYGWEEFAKYSVEKREHTHSIWTQIAWTAGIPAAIMLISLLFINGVNSLILMIKRKKLLLIPFVVAVVIVGFSTVGCLDDVFRASRRVTFPFWIIFTLPLTPVFYKDIKSR